MNLVNPDSIRISFLNEEGSLDEVSNVTLGCVALAISAELQRRGEAEVLTDNDGQVVIYTGRTEEPTATDETVMGKLHSETVCRYERSGGGFIDIDLCWQGKEPENDADRFYDFYDHRGRHLNPGNPWHDAGNGVPTEAEVNQMVGTTDTDDRS